MSENELIFIAVLVGVLSLLLVMYVAVVLYERRKARSAPKPHIRQLLEEARRQKQLREQSPSLVKSAHKRDAEWYDAGGTWN